MYQLFSINSIHVQQQIVHHGITGAERMMMMQMTLNEYWMMFRAVQQGEEIKVHKV